MNRKLLESVFVATVTSFALVGCAAEAEDEGETPDVSEETLDTLDEGTSYNGWTMSIWGGLTHTMTPDSVCHPTLGINYRFTRTSGDATRGGGVCYVRATGQSCTNDEACTTNAKSTHGSTAYGYCYKNKCYARPGGANYCVMAPNNNPSTYYYNTINPAIWSSTTTNHILGCMTKTAGPNTACGGTNTAQYMRQVQPLQYTNACPYGPNGDGIVP